MEKKIRLAFLPLGLYSDAFEEVFKSLGNVEIVKGVLSEKTIQKGVKHSPVMVCYPYKVILGYMMDVLEKGANKLVTLAGPSCRINHFWKMQERTLRDLGYDDFEFVVLNRKNFIKQIKGLNPKSGYIKAIQALYSGWKMLREMEKSTEEFDLESISKKDINILVIGEYYTIFMKEMNLNVVDKIKKFGAKPKYGAPLSQLLFGKPENLLKKDKYQSEASSYLNGEIGGYGLETIASVIYGCDKGFDGIVRIMPMSCMPEITVEPAITSICRKKGMPLLTVECDEHNSELNLETRLETFIELIRRKKISRDSLKRNQ